MPRCYLLLSCSGSAVDQHTNNVTLFNLRVYVSDVVPDPVLVGVIVLAVPALGVLTALFALRRTIIEPLGVVRYTKPVRRRLWWRLVLWVSLTCINYD